MTRYSSHMMRAAKGPTLPQLEGRCHELDSELGTAWVDASVTMDALVQWSLPQGWVPPVVTEFKGITVGGAIMGAALESSSFRHGQFNDICLDIELELPNGRVLQVSPHEHLELFYGLSGSYGSLGRIKRVHLRMVRAYAQVEVRARVVPTSSIQKILGTRLPDDVDFVDAVVLDAERTVFMKGRNVERAEGAHVDFKRPWSKWFCQRVVESARKSKEWCWCFPTYDYLFRYDLGAFWMGQFPTSRGAVGKFIRERYQPPEKLAASLHSALRMSPATLTPSLLTRLLLRSKISSTHLYDVLHRVPTEVLARTFLVQDFYIPKSHLQDFIGTVCSELAIYPLWLCPMRATQTPQFLSPHYNGEDMVNVGIYGIPKHYWNIKKITRDLEAYANSLGGRKMLYALSYYSTQEFWNEYDKERYDLLRAEYGLEELPNIYQRTHA